MNITFLLGNGLDLNCGCKSSYQDIYQSYVQQPSYNKEIEEFKNDIITWGDFEMDMARFAGKFDNEEIVLTCIRDFKRYMDYFLLSENTRMKNILSGSALLSKEILSEIGQSLRNFHQNCIPNVSKETERKFNEEFVYYDFVSFNYTSFLDPILIRVATDISRDSHGSIDAEPFYRKPSFIHLHGTLGGKEVLGVDNLEQFGQLKYNINSLETFFVKPVCNALVDSDRIKQTEKAIMQADVICVFGMSLGDSDLTWRNKLLDWLQADKSHELFLYDYDCTKSKAYFDEEKLEVESDARKSFLKKCGFQADLQGKIHMPIRANLFNIKSVIEKVKQIELSVASASPKFEGRRMKK